MAVEQTQLSNVRDTTLSVVYILNMNTDKKIPVCHQLITWSLYLWFFLILQLKRVKELAVFFNKVFYNQGLTLNLVLEFSVIALIIMMLSWHLLKTVITFY